MHIVIAMPVYEDWDSALHVCQRIDSVLSSMQAGRVDVLLIDDGSVNRFDSTRISWRPAAINQISVLGLRRNLGHQRAIAIGLAYIHQSCKCDAVVVMDADGEDRPEDLPKLLAAMNGGERPTAVFAERGRRLENVIFRVFYQCYRALHRILTGRDIRFGNFSVLPWPHLESLVVLPDLWNHYAATVLKSRLPYVRVPSDRGARVSGRSHMDFVSLVVHGLSGLFANQEVVGTRLLMMFLVMMGVLLMAMGVVVGVRLFTSLGIPGWATSTIGLLLVLGVQALIACFLLIFSIMMNRSNLGFLPLRDYAYFVRGCTTLYIR
jgi:glycosyltransferase involved in cell wall biosynthesis